MRRVSDNKGKTMQKHWKHALYATIAACGLYGQMVMAQGPIEKIPRAGTQARYHVGDSIQAGSGTYGNYQITGRGSYRDGQKLGNGQTYRPTAADAGHKNTKSSAIPSKSATARPHLPTKTRHFPPA